ncbi:hypothetical protein [Streptomyces sp. NBC_00459]|uniref:hypothetical protein n=1 Tax=Streptomyces sp. NBC_00459 TaxID=2975749 RepID=UPI002E195FBA
MLWAASVEASAVEAGASGSSPAADECEQDLSWLGELDLVDFRRGHTGSRVNVEITYRAQMIEVELGSWVRFTDPGWVVTGPATYW